MGPEAVDPGGVAQRIKVWPGNPGNRRFKIHKGTDCSRSTVTVGKMCCKLPWIFDQVKTMSDDREKQ